jgi:hypothetical protein
MNLLLLLALSVHACHASPSDVIDNKSSWLKITQNVAFQRNPNLKGENQLHMDIAAHEAIHRFLGTSKKSRNQTFGASPYENGMLNSGTQWSSYQLAWRLLGFYLDCNQDENQEHKNRKLKEDEGNSGCSRYVMYAVVSSSCMFKVHLACCLDRSHVVLISMFGPRNAETNP